MILKEVSDQFFLRRHSIPQAYPFFKKSTNGWLILDSFSIVNFSASSKGLVQNKPSNLSREYLLQK